MFAKYRKSRYLPVILLHGLFLLSGLAKAQNVPLGSWAVHVPLQNATSVCQSKSYVYAACQNGVIGVDISNNLIERYTKVSGLSEVFADQVGYDTATSTLVVSYTNSNIDLIKNGKTTNLPYLKNSTLSGDKNIYRIYCFNGKAYLATGFGIVEIDLDRQEIADTYTFNNGITTAKVNAVWADENAIFCATSNGVVMGKIDPAINLLDYNEWVKYTAGIPQAEASAVTKYQDKVLAVVNSTIYQFDGTSWTPFFSDPNWVTKDLNIAYGQLSIAQHKIISGNVTDVRIGKWNGTGFDFYSNNFYIAYPLQTIADKDGSLWHADLYRGLVRQEGANFNAKIPNGPYSVNSKEMDFLNGTLWSSSSAIRNSFNPNDLPESKFFFACKDYNWTNYIKYDFPILDTFNQIAVVKALPSENKVLFGAAGFADGGIIEFSPADNSFKTIKYAPNNPGSFRITGADVDPQGNAWFSNAYSTSPVICRKNDGSYLFFNSGFLNAQLVTDILVDDYNQIWIAKDHPGVGGLVVLNYGADLDDKSDDQYFNLALGRGLGNLPSNHVVCMAKDKDGVLWLGTTAGIAVVSCAGYVTDYACEAEQICIDRKDSSGFCDNLLEDEIVNCITVDEANRKWIGTANGLFLVSADGQETIHYFNETNSPLLGNDIRSVTINPETGDVFIGTSKGICSYRADATVTTAETSAPFVYPNPVREDYDGPIAFKGIPNNCNVKIVDVSGNLVYETTATGGQATWDGKLINGQRAATGVYFALCSGSGKGQKASLKFVLVH